MPAVLSRDRLAALLAAAARRRIAVVGDAMLDVYLRGDVDRVSPEAPVPVMRVRERHFALGGAANVAQNVRALGADCQLVAAVGADPDGRQIRAMLSDIGADPASPVDTDLRIVYDQTSQLRIIDRAYLAER